MSPDTLALFLSASIALGISPGPDNLFVLAQSSQHGSRAGLLVTLGLCSGLIVHTSLVALGVAVIFQTSTVAFTVLKVIGAAYLIYLALQAFRSTALPSGTQTVSATRLYSRGIVMNVTNPKVAIFFLAFLPQFVEPEAGDVTLQITVLGALFIIATLLVFGAIALLAGSLSQRLFKSESAQKYLNYVAGFVFVGLAARLLIAER